MKKLSGYIKENRKLNQNVNVSYGWEDEIYENTKALFYDVNTTYGIKKVFAFVSFPTSKKPTGGYPVIILIHGGNGCAFYEMTKLWADRGYVAIAPDFNGTYAKNITQRKLDNEKADIKGYGSFHDIDAENPWAYFSVLSCMSALDFLLSQEIVNEEFIFSCGLGVVL